MIGFTLSLNHRLQAADYNYLIAMRNAGFKQVLAAVEPQREDEEQLAARLAELSKWCQNLDLTLIMHAQADSWNQLGINLEDVGQVQTAGLKGIAAARQVKSTIIAKLSKSLPVLVEAGKFTADEIASLHEDNANLNNVMALFPAFPLAETGLTLDWLRQRIAWLKQHGIGSAAFVPSDQSGAPTVESQRGVNPLAAFLALKKAGCVHLLLAGRPLSTKMIAVFANYLKLGKISLHLERADKTLINSEWRTDPYLHQKVIPLLSQTKEPSNLKTVEAEGQSAYGSLGLMEEQASSGLKKLMINKSHSPLRPQFAFLAQIEGKDLSLLPYIGPNQSLLFLPVK